MDFEKHHERMLLRHEKAIADIDRKLAATASLVRVGMKLTVNDRKDQKEFNREQQEFNREFNLKLNALIEAQMRTEEAQRKTEEAQRKTEEAMRRTDEILRKNDEKFNRLMDRMLRKNGHGQQSS